MKSHAGPARGTASRTARVSIARWNLKEADGKTLVRRTETTYEANTRDKRAKRLKVQFLHRTRGRRCGGHKREGHRALPGEVSDGAIKLAHSKGCDDAGGEVSRGHSSRGIDEGLNRLKAASAGFQTLIGQLRRKTATGRRCGTDSRKVCSGGYSRPGACATKQGSTEPPDTWTVRPVVWEDGGGQPPPPTRFQGAGGQPPRRR